MKSKLGLVLAGIYVLGATYLIATQGLFGESFIALILGLPWSLIPSFFEFGGIENPTMLAILLLAPIALNTALLYWIGSLLSRRRQVAEMPAA
jgi:hypothetical protein